MVQRIRHLVAKVLMLLLAVCMVFGAAFLFAGCSDDGKSVQSFAIKNGELIVTYTDGTTDNLGSVVGSNGTQGDQGPQGPQGEQGDKGDKGDKGEPGRGIEKVEIVDGNLMVTYTDSDTPVNVGKVDEADAIAVADIKTEVVDGTTYIVITYTDPEKEATRIPVDSLLPTCEHDFYEITLTEATCAQGGVVLSVCQNDCGTALIDFTDPNPDNHTYVDTLTMPTCEADGFITRTCTNGDSTVTVTLAEIVADAEGDGIYSELLAENEITDPANQLKATGHNYQYDYVEPTCTANGYFTYVCANNEEETGTITMEQIAADFELDEADRQYTAICTAEGITAASDMAMTGHSGADHATELTVVDEGANICVDGGQKLLVCSYCLEYVYGAEPIPAEGHVVTADWRVTVEPTATTDGQLTGACSVCGLSAATVTIPALNSTNYSEEDGEIEHTQVATCTTPGFDTYKVTIKGWSGSFTVETSTMHRYNNHQMPLDEFYTADQVETVFVNATGSCLEGSGYGYFTCQDCDREYLVRITGDHVYSEENFIEHKDPTCYEQGYDAYECQVCGKTVYEYIEMTEHVYGEPEYVAGVDGAPGTVTFTCTNEGCSDELSDTHTLVIECESYEKDEEASFAATCQAPGKDVYTYTYYDEEEVLQTGTVEIILPQLDHTSAKGTVYDPARATEDTDNPYTVSQVDSVFANFSGDCTVQGWGYIICATCPEDHNEYLVRIIGDHEYDEGVLTAPTCTEAGYITYTCSVCPEGTAGHTLTITQADIDAAQTNDEAAYAEYMAILEAADLTSLNALGHVYTEEPDINIDEETLSGTITFTCDRCDTPWTVSGRNFKKDAEQSVASTCTTAGYDYYTYEYDLPNEGGVEESFIKVPLPLASHKSEKETVYDPARATENTENPYTVSEVDSVFENFSGSCIERGWGYIKCATCPEGHNEYLVRIIGDHDFGDQEEWLVKEPTCTEAGYQYKICTVCGDEVKNPDSPEVPATGHTFVYTVTAQATTTTAGTLVVTCEDCDYEKEYVLPAITADNGYTIGASQEPSCEAEGYANYSYVVMDGETVVWTYNVTVTIPAVDHDLEDGRVYTWNFEGYTYTGTYCETCEQIIVTNKTPIETETPEVGA